VRVDSGPICADRCSEMVLRHTLIVLLLALTLGSARGTRADEDANVAAPPLETLERALEGVRNAPPEDQQAQRLKELYTSAVQHLRAAADNRREVARFEKLYADAPQRSARFTEELQSLQRTARRITISRDASVERLERRLDEIEARVAALRTEEISLGNTTSTLQTRVDAARQELKSLGDVAARREGAPVPRPGENAELTRARLDEWLALQDYRASQRQKLETEVRTLPARLDARKAELKLVSLQRELAERDLADIAGQEQLRRIAEASQLREQTAARASGIDSAIPEIRALATEVRALGDEYVEVVTRFESGSANVARAQRSLEELRSSLSATRQQLEIAALSDALGPVLVEQYMRLDDFQKPDRELATLAVMLSETRLREFRIEQLREQSSSRREQLEAVVSASHEGKVREFESAMEEADQLLEDRDALLDALGGIYVKLTGHIIELDAVYQEQSTLAGNFRQLLDRNLIWMKSHAPLRLPDLLAFPGALVALIAAQDWATLMRELPGALPGPPLGTALGTLVLLALWRNGRFLRQRLGSIGQRATGWKDYRFHMALQALGIHVLLALPLPLVLMWSGSVLTSAYAANPLAAALGGAATRLATLSFGYLFLLGLFQENGFARQHLRWKTARVLSVGRWLRLGLQVLLPMGFVLLTLREFADTPSGALVHRVVSVFFCVAFLAFSVVLVRAGSGMFGGAFYARRFVLAGRAGRALVLLLLALQPVALLLDVQGYYFTAGALQIRLLATIVILVLAKLVIDTGLLGLTIAGQRTAMAREQHAQDELAAADGPAEADLEKMNASAIALLQVFALGLTAAVLMSLWSQFFTALTILDSIDLWQFETSLEGKTVLGSVTVFDLLGAILLFGVSLIVARGLPALLGIVLYSFVTRKGVLFAIQTVISYTAVAAGFFLSLQMLGFGWSKLQWMAAGLSVGLGFGLQEIFANFFAGLIMLFERPVRIGDVITLGEYSGTIQRIRMRATTITDFDNREIIVPNKMFVTERLINWTLSSSVVRMSFDVGVSYGADPRLVRETLLELIAADARVLKDPPPNVVFREFGASSLNFRCFGHVEDINLRFQVQSELHIRITEVFREKGIEIAYPQMDLHLRTVDPDAGARLSGGVA